VTTKGNGTRGRRAAAVAAASAVLLGSGVGMAHAAVDPALGYDAQADKGSLHNIASVIGALDGYRAGYTGKGVGVALIDTGVTPVPGLDTGNVVNGPDLSFDSQNPATAHLDGFGHGTHMASIIAGRDAVGTPASYADPGRFNGIAPDANLVNVKVGASNGDVDVSQVIAAIDWVVEHRNDEKLNIRVINLSYGTDSVQDSLVDPLAYAVENAWRNGIVVVVAGGNEGDTTTNLANPASDPHVLAVGAMDSAGTVATADDTVPSWSTDGTAERHVDVTAPGVSVLGLRAPGSAADTQNPDAHVGDRFLRGSGTSQAAAVVSGEAALLFQAKPDLTPDQVKQILMGSATGLNNVSTLLEGSGTTDLRKALRTVPRTVANPAPWGTGTGSLEAARGSFHVVAGDDATGEVVLQGEVDVFGQAWDGAAWARLTSDRKVWDRGSWRGITLTAPGWAGARGMPKSWPTAVWNDTGAVLAAGDWTGRMWRDGDWAGRMWRDGAWSGRMWRDGDWSGRMWRGSTFSSAGWF
jgi:serine protease AprX